MKKVLLMRHAKSSWKDPSLADFERPLNKRGKRDAPRMGAFLMDTDIKIDIILSSPAKRARQTVKRFLREYSFDGKLILEDELYHSDHTIYIDLLNNLPNEIDSIMIVGHNPEMDYFLDTVCDVYEHMPTGAIAVINLPIDDWKEINTEISGELVSFWKPREI
jgi:phosphohistidine phosphatase